MMKIFRWVVFVIVYLALVAYAASAQTVSPIITEYHSGKVAKGEFTVRNDSLQPLDVSIDPLSFSVDSKGDPHFRPLDTAMVHLKMDSFTAHVGAKQQRVFFYEVRCDQLPCWFSIYSVMTVGKTKEGMNVALRLPHTIYFCSKEKNCREHVRRDLWGLPK